MKKDKTISEYERIEYHGHSRKFISEGNVSINDGMNYNEFRELENLKIQYDILKQGIVQQNKIMQILLSIVVAFGGTFELTFCLCKQSCLTCLDIVLNIFGLALTATAIILIGTGLRCSNDKQLERRLAVVKKLFDIRDFIDYYELRVKHLTRINIRKEADIKISIIMTVFVGVVSVILDVFLLVGNLA